MGSNRINLAFKILIWNNFNFHLRNDLSLFVYICKKEIMDLQSRKLRLIEYLVALQDEQKIEKIESTVFEANSDQDKLQRGHKLTVEELVNRANRSTNDFFAGRFKTQDQLEKESENW